VKEQQGVTTPEPFALLLPVYIGDHADYLRAAFRSAVHDQTVRPDHVLLVRDGPVTDELKKVIDELRADSPVPVQLVPIERSTGLGPALDAGLAASPHDIVARMDADDIAMPNRFEVQLPLIRAGADIVGAGLVEFELDPATPGRRRVPPTDPDQIRHYARIHDPFNHPTVIYRRAAVLAAGGYGDLPLMEDYWLFSRMLAGGARPMNVAEPLVYYRVGAGAYQRRGGRDQLRSEIALQRRLRGSGMITQAQYVRNVIVRGGYRLLPWRLRRSLYRLVVAGYGARRGRGRPSIASSGYPPGAPDAPQRETPPHGANPNPVRGASNS
jgi:glycosyltransferase involved in cell wall biosynthesis